VNLPWKSIELVVGHKNIWANLQNENPGRIMFNLHDSRRWLPYFDSRSFFTQFTHYKSNKINKQTIVSQLASSLGLSLSKETEQQVKNMSINDLMQLTQNCWFMPNIGSYFDFSPCKPSLSFREKSKLEELICKNVKFTIHTHRSTLNLETRWKEDSTKLKSLMRHFLGLLHCESIRKLSPQILYREFRLWVRKLKENIPVGFNCRYLPLRFSVNDPERIR
jgi:hypothetical protein